MNIYFIMIKNFQLALPLFFILIYFELFKCHQGFSLNATTVLPLWHKNITKMLQYCKYVIVVNKNKNAYYT